MEPWYFVMMFAGTCGHCTNFKKDKLNDVLNALKTYPRVKVIQINLNGMNDVLPTNVGGENIPVALNNYKIHYPIFILVPPQGWKSGTLEGTIIFGTKVEGGKITSLPSNPNKDTLLEWAKSNIENIPVIPAAPAPLVVPKMIPTEGSCNFRIIARK